MCPLLSQRVPPDPWALRGGRHPALDELASANQPALPVSSAGKRSRAMSRRWPQCKNNPIQPQRDIKSGDGTVTQTLEVWNCTRKTPYMHAWVGGAQPLSPRASSSELLCMKTLAWKSSMKLIPNGALLVETKMENIWRGVTITISEDAASTEGPLHIDSP